MKPVATVSVASEKSPDGGGGGAAGGGAGLVPVSEEHAVRASRAATVVTAGRSNQLAQFAGAEKNVFRKPLSYSPLASRVSNVVGDPISKRYPQARPIWFGGETKWIRRSSRFGPGNRFFARPGGGGVPCPFEQGRHAAGSPYPTVC